MTEYIDPANALLCDEDSLPQDELENRLALAHVLYKNLPGKVLEALSVWQPAVGCVNRCSFCSQESGNYLRMLNGASVRTIAGAFRCVQHLLGLPYVSCRRQYKPGIIFPYLDNDIGVYPYLIDYLVSAWSLGMKVRTSTIGWNRKNEQLNRMHKEIVQKYSHMLAGVRFSLNTYSTGWRTNHESFIDDFIHAMQTYRPLLRLDTPEGNSGGCIDLSMAPDIIPCEVEISAIEGFHVVSCREYCVISAEEEGEAWMITGTCIPAQAVEWIRRHSVLPSDLTLTHGRISEFGNEDGMYLGFYPDSSRHITDGLFFFSANSKRKGGVFAACWPLREFADYLRGRDLETDTFADLEQQAILFADAPCHTERRSRYLHNAMLPLVQALCRVIDALHLPPKALFDQMVVRDRGMIRNSGRAYYEFRAIASKPNIMVYPEPTLTSGLAEEVWRIFPAMQDAAPVTVAAQGGKSILPAYDASQVDRLCLVAWAVDAPSHAHSRKDGSLRESFYIPIQAYVSPLEVYDLRKAQAAGLAPGE